MEHCNFHRPFSFLEAPTVTHPLTHLKGPPPPRLSTTSASPSSTGGPGDGGGHRGAQGGTMGTMDAT